ncbi:hypothetical protein [Dipodfec virus UOA04_Rod_708]|nr:hypothetical protein [Dipodfec virus UOA04_Rod_708]
MLNLRQLVCCLPERQSVSVCVLDPLSSQHDMQPSILCPVADLSVELEYDFKRYFVVFVSCVDNVLRLTLYVDFY